MAIASDQMTTAEDAPELTTPPAPHEPLTPDSEGPRSRRPAYFLLGLTLVLCVLVTACAVLGVRIQDGRHAAERDAQVLDTTRTVLAQLVSLNHNSAQQDLDRIAANATGQFRDQFDSVADSFAQVLGNGQVESTGEVKAAGIVDANDDTATVLAAVTSLVKNSEAPEGQPRVYRMKATLNHIDNQWLVASVEFVA
ncbi:hypothetical protein [Rhodococcus opacus]|uniref:hypothetical protein n=1 Tax=Rhodococcus opacus TaxID=37919 RepID=UPI0010DA4C23|nr:hypothetical protein [Rhodococcus opacus]UZG52818.1 hypothetical protein ONE62_22030 [Rhodococcus opacus]